MPNAADSRLEVEAVPTAEIRPFVAEVVGLEQRRRALDRGSRYRIGESIRT
jgi:hypothetical protein